MKKILYLIVGALLILTGCTQDCKQASEHNNEVREAVERIMAAHPQSTLQDIYKSCFQDMFGPGHLIGDTAAARQYLLSELTENDYIDTVLAEPTGIHGNYIRVNLLLVKQGIISEETLLNAVINSANSATMPQIEEWRSQRLEIVAEIKAMDLALPHFEEDCAMLEALLAEGKFVMHHSDLYGKSYHPHYRIVANEIYGAHIAKYTQDVTSAGL